MDIRRLAHESRVGISHIKKYDKINLLSKNSKHDFNSDSIEEAICLFVMEVQGIPLTRYYLEDYLGRPYTITDEDMLRLHQMLEARKIAEDRLKAAEEKFQEVEDRLSDFLVHLGYIEEA